MGFYLFVRDGNIEECDTYRALSISTIFKDTISYPYFFIKICCILMTFEALSLTSVVDRRLILSCNVGEFYTMPSWFYVIADLHIDFAKFFFYEKIKKGLTNADCVTKIKIINN